MNITNKHVTTDRNIWKHGSRSTATVDRVQDRDLGCLWSSSRSTATVNRQFVLAVHVVEGWFWFVDQIYRPYDDRLRCYLTVKHLG